MSSVNVTKTAISYGFAPLTEEIFNGNFQFYCALQLKAGLFA